METQSEIITNKELKVIKAAGIGWFEWFKMPQHTTYIAYVYESGSVYLPEVDATYADFYTALTTGNAFRLMRVQIGKETNEETPC